MIRPISTRRVHHVLASMSLVVVAAVCAGHGVVPIGPLPFPTDTVRSEIVADGVVHRFIYSPTGPWAIHVLDVDLSRCNAAVAVKGADTAAGRIRTTTMLGGLSMTRRVVGGVNADFFSLATGTPVGMLIVDGRMLSRPSARPVLAFDSSGAPRIAEFSLVDGKVSPWYPRHAVGGRPMLVRDSSVLDIVDHEGQPSFSVDRHPRTAAGIAARGRRLILAVVDGRQKPYSDGMSLRELANLMRALGAREAINLDGGGSSTMVYADPRADGRLRLANRPSDKQGERAVGDALAIVNACR